VNKIFFGDAVETLIALAVRGVRAQSCVTSPPYYGLRDYGVPPTEWPAMSYKTLGAQVEVPAMTCCLGLEESPEAFVGHLVLVFRAVRDALEDDGTLWLNIGDSYAGSWGNQGRKETRGTQRPINGDMMQKVDDGRYPSKVSNTGKIPAGSDLKAKDLIGIPWMLVFALRADGWYLRQEIIWAKPNPMPESVTDRCTKAHESIFLLSKSPQYYFDHEAIKEPAVGGAPGNVNAPKGAKEYLAGDEHHRTKSGLAAYAQRQRTMRDSFKREGSKRAVGGPGQSMGTHRPDRDESTYDLATRNKRSVWTVPTRPYKGAHSATFPPALIEPCILAGAPPGAIILDPFMGSGTTAAVSLKNGRQYIGCELFEGNAQLQQDRIDGVLVELLAEEAARELAARQADMFHEPVAEIGS
jgi:DNA modification methylase